MDSNYLAGSGDCHSEEQEMSKFKSWDTTEFLTRQMSLKCNFYYISVGFAGLILCIKAYSLLCGCSSSSPQCYINFCLIISGFLVRTVSVLPARRGSERSRWRCVCGTRFITWSASNVRRVRSTSVWATATCSSTQTLCASKTSSSGPNSTITTLCSWISVTLPRFLLATKGTNQREKETFCGCAGFIIIWLVLTQKPFRFHRHTAPCWRRMKTAPASDFAFHRGFYPPMWNILKHRNYLNMQ